MKSLKWVNEADRAILADFAELAADWKDIVDLIKVAKQLSELNGVELERFVRTGEYA